MIKCPFCEAEQVANTIFCSECGVYLLEDERRGTEALELDSIKWGDEPLSHPEATKLGTGILAVRLKICDSGREFEASLSKAIHLGRLDATSEVFPEVDLTDDNGLEKGVSRRHARIFKRDGNIVVEDLGSINGTFVNGKRLAPYLPELLNDGDQLLLGNLAIDIMMS